IFFLSGIFGVLSLNSTFVSQQNILFPILSGLFGLSLLFISLSQKSKIPTQVFDDQLNISKTDLMKSVILGSVAGLMVGFLPAIGVSQAATIVQILGSTGEARNFLVTLSGINISNEIFSLVSLYLVNNPRSGASVAIEKILGGLAANDVVFLVGFICFSAGIAALLTIFLSKRIPKYLEKIDYQKLTLAIIIFMISMVAILTGLGGLLILFTSVSIGLLCNFLGIRKSHCMGVLLLPSILFFAGLG
ncbi:MAG: tripartite tricarboxylate transporter permease, partial [Candidatus Aenigmatarchaeota archaeon]